MQQHHHACRTLILCVDSYEDSVPVGRFYLPGSKRSYPFRSLTQFLQSTEHTLNTMAFPQSFTAPRTLTSGTASPVFRFVENRCQEGLMATFAIRIHFRQNASWQGSVQWMEGGRTQSFRSVLELIFLLDGVLTDVSDRNAG